MGLKHLEFHSHLCLFQVIKTSFVLKLVRCVLNGIINTTPSLLSGCIEGRSCFIQSGVSLLLPQSIFRSQLSFRKRIHTCPYSWTLGIVFYENQNGSKTSFIFSSHSLKYAIIKGRFWKQSFISECRLESNRQLC